MLSAQNLNVTIVMQDQYSFKNIFVFLALENERKLDGDHMHGAVNVCQHHQLLGEVILGSIPADKPV